MANALWEADEIRAAGGRAVAVPTEVTDAQQLQALAIAAINEFGSLSIRVNNADGSPVQTPLAELPEEE